MPSAPPRTRPGGAARSAPAARKAPARRPAPRTRDHDARFKVGRIVLVVALALATLKLVTVQTLQAAELKAAAERQRTVELVVPAERGAILDRAGSPLAFSVEARALVANPRTLARTLGDGTATMIQEMATAVAASTGQDRAELVDKLSADRGYVVLAEYVDPDVARDLRDRFPLIAEEYREKREYPGGSLASSIVGFSRWDAGEERITGREGLENSQDNLLAGSPGLRVVGQAEESAAEIPGSTQFERPVVPGSDLQLTLDSDLQFTVQRALADEVAATGAGESSSAVVLDVATGQVLALANGGDADRSTGSGGGNPAVTSPFEPGSVNKVVTMAAALEYGLATPDEVLAVPGTIDVADRTIKDAWSHGTENYTLTGVLAKSSNVGTIMTAQRVGEDRFAAMLAAFGVGVRTEVGLPGESPGSVPAREAWSGSTFGNLPIGQGLSMTVLQMAGMYQAIANDGVRIPPRIVAGTIGPDGLRTPTPAPEPVRVVSPETAAQVRTMLTAVTQDARGQRGTGPQAAVPGYQVAGKTGTAQQVDPECACYSRSSYWITFAGMIPAQDPRYVVAIMLDAPAGGSSAAPLFHDIASYLAQREGLPVSAEPAPVQTLVAP
ncbi:cell division protein FtsI [Pseudonocardia hydrocarbonoxydans]|uniref:Cell division protein FtsI n=1 Tax=Pseudonocardia hydrocarbonoxydans TaxID=76726 RepID=A0A4Y3WI72_9PSEU|nr:penicillin-binding protein 2 [Pseudonocardia hydrocarbonoxydans]GEC18573.1 cell division protein FtsI [Pseudonocardia hydrocarbonoxydans]